MTNVHNDTHSEAVSRRIRALLNKTVDNGCTEEEAIAAATKARALMDQYRLTMTDIEFKAEPMVDKSFDRRLKVRTGPADYCIPGIQKYCGVRMWRHWEYMHFQKALKVRVLGLRDDTDFAEYLYQMIDNTVWNSTSPFLKTLDPALNASRKRAAVWSFELGMAIRINERLVKMAAALEPVAKTASGTALVVVRNQLVDEAFAKLNLRFSKRHQKGMNAGDYRAYRAGLAAGDKVNLGRPVGGAQAKQVGGGTAGRADR